MLMKILWNYVSLDQVEVQRRLKEVRTWARMGREAWGEALHRGVGADGKESETGGKQMGDTLRYEWKDYFKFKSFFYFSIVYLMFNVIF